MHVDSSYFPVMSCVAAADAEHAAVARPPGMHETWRGLHLPLPGREFRYGPFRFDRDRTVSKCPAELQRANKSRGPVSRLRGALAIGSLGTSHGRAGDERDVLR
jgi:hypothetical protein